MSPLSARTHSLQAGAICLGQNQSTGPLNSGLLPMAGGQFGPADLAKNLPCYMEEMVPASDAPRISKLAMDHNDRPTTPRILLLQIREIHS